MDNLGRFYDIMGCYLYDYRLAAFAIVELGRRKFSPKNIYIDLLNLKVDKWVIILETVAENIKHTELREWCNRKQTTLNSLEIDFWRNDDMTIIEEQFYRHTGERV